MTGKPSPGRKTLLVIHHSHTDVGYTGPQHRILCRQVDYLRQVLAILAAAGDAEDAEDAGDAGAPNTPVFKWVCECYWAVESFLARATTAERAAFTRAVQSGRIGLSASYLNFNELIDYPLLCRSIRRATEYGRSISVPVDSAMTADINGYGWGFSQALLDSGVLNLFTCIHTHHGLYPVGQKPCPFWWEAPGGGKLLVFSGEHYHLGNELGIVPGAVSSYLTKDECDAEMIHGDPWGVAELRIPRYFDRLAASSYPLDFAPVMASGLRTDNAPPSKRILDFIRRWNRVHGDRYQVRMVTLSEFFRLLREQPLDLPTYRGDWPDWWSDGPAADPGATMRFRQAQRELEYYHLLRKRYPRLETQPTGSIEDDLLLYAEHTFGHAESMNRPWDPQVQAVAEHKRAHAARALAAVQEVTDTALVQLGASVLQPDRPLLFKVLNPLPEPITGPVGLFVGHYEYRELKLDRGVEVWDRSGRCPLPFDREPAPLGARFLVHLELAAGQERLLEIRPGAGPAPRTDVVATTDRLETPFVRLSFQPEKGITGWIDKPGGRQLIRPGTPHAPFTPVYEVTPVTGPDRQAAVRGAMLLNRKGVDVRRSAGILKKVRPLESGQVQAAAELEYEVKGLKFLFVTLRAHADEPRVDVAVRLHKESVWEPENLYLALPFQAGRPGGRLWLDKAGARIRPWRDQIPGSLTDYYAVQAGLAVTTADLGLIVATPDSHLVQLGPLEPGRRLLMGDPALRQRKQAPYAWLMNNFWETNFTADLGGFHEFRFFVKWGTALRDPDRALTTCRNLNREIRWFRLGQQER